MLLRLQIRGLCLLSDVSLDFNPGLNVITGETGAGKSLLVGALGLLLGQVSAAGLVRASETSARIQVDIDCSEVPEALWKEVGEPRKLARVELSIEAPARVRARLDGQALSLARVRKLMRAAVSLTGQGATRGLLTPEAVLAVLDAGAGLAPQVLRYRTLHSALREVDARFRAAQSALGEREQRSLRLGTLLSEFCGLGPRDGEHTELSRRIEVLGRAQQYLELCARVHGVLFERDSSIDAELRALLHAVRRAPPLADFGEIQEALATALGAIERAGRRSARLAEDLSVEPAELARLERRRDELERLGARLAVSPDALPEQGERLSAELGQLAALEGEIQSLERQRDALRTEALELAVELHCARERALPRLVQQLGQELSTLALQGAELGLVLERGEQLGASGLSQLELGFSANPGEPLAPLDRVASGGERSRVVLALACAGVARGKTLVFDEIDQGVGGKAVDALGQRLARLGREQQVLCITHQAGIAARAHAHWLVEKSTLGGNSVTRVVELGDEGRTQELSRLLTGGRAADGARALARRLLAEARSAA